jgi:hypothetical protein
MVPLNTFMESSMPLNAGLSFGLAASSSVMLSEFSKPQLLAKHHIALRSYRLEGNTSILGETSNILRRPQSRLEDRY